MLPLASQPRSNFLLLDAPLPACPWPPFPTSIARTIGASSQLTSRRQDGKRLDRQANRQQRGRHDGAGGAGINSREAEIETKLNEIATRTIDIIAGHSRMNAADITRDTALDEIGINSLELTEVVMDLEDLYDIEIDLNAAEAWEALKNVGDVVDAIHRLVSARN